MKVLFLVNCSNFFYSHFLKLAISVKNEGHEVCIAVGNNLQKENIEKLGFEFYELNLSRSEKNLFYELSSMISIYKLLRDFQPELVHMLTIKPILYGSLIMKLFKSLAPKKIVASVTGLGSSSMSQSFSGKLLWWCLKLAYKFTLSSNQSKVIFENTDDRELFVKNRIVSNENSYLVNGAGVDIIEFSPSLNKSEVVTVILVARLLKDKGVREYIEAGGILNELNVNVQLLLVGSVDENNPSSMSEVDISIANKKGFIKSLGYRADIDQCYKSAHIACLPSYREGLPKSLIEAAACGLAIITTDVPGCRQMVTQNKNGVLVPAKDSYLLAMAIKDLVENEGKIHSMGKESRKIAEQIFSYESVIASFFDIYDFNIEADSL
jgi:glycosyltransferase involved in cell wall biosynthesis